MPSCESEKVTKTLMAYMTTRVSIWPWGATSTTSAVAPMSTTPLAVVRRAESEANRRGSHESTAMFDITRGPSMKPACAATRSRAASEASTRKTKILPRGRPKSRQLPAKASTRTPFKVLPSAGATLKSR